MGFSQLLWTIRSNLNDRLESQLYNVPISARTHTEKLDGIVAKYAFLEEFVSSTSHCEPSPATGKCKGLYHAAFRDGVANYLLSLNNIFRTIEETFLSESSFSMLEIFHKFGQTECVLSSLCDAVKQLKEGKYYGCAILNLCEQYINEGNNSVRSVFTIIQNHCWRQFYKQTKLWMLQTELYDPFSEFIISSYEENHGNDSYNTTSLSHTTNSSEHFPLSISSGASGYKKFKVNVDNLPHIIPLSVAMKMVFIGEALLICHKQGIGSEGHDEILPICGISEQSILSQLNEIEKKPCFIMKDFVDLIDSVWTGVNKYIRKLSDEVGEVSEQLNLMWEIYLLGRGELFQEFLLKGGTLLKSKATQMDGRNLNKVFKNAVYSVYLTENSPLTDQFSFVGNTQCPGSTTWSNMYLKYKIKWPLHYLFTPEVIKKYNRLFRFLLMLKKAQMDVTVWKTLSHIRDHSFIMELMDVRMLLVAVVGNLQNYCFTYVISDEMKTLNNSVKNSTMFTDLQKALILFLTHLENRLFLQDRDIMDTATFSSLSSSPGTIYKCLLKIFKLCQLFSELDGKDIEKTLASLKSIKSKLLGVLKILFSHLQYIDKTSYCDQYSMLLSIDYNGFLRNKLNIERIET